MRYKGKYRIKANIDKETNDYPRNEQGNIETDDLYIKCIHGSQIYHYGHSVLIAYIPSIGRGHNILRAMGEELLGTSKKLSYEELFEKLEQDGTIKNIVENDKEIEFSFNSSNIEFVAKYLKPCTSGANISPFSTRNLPKTKYNIPNEDLNAYRNIVAKKYAENNLSLTHRTNEFLKTLSTKKNSWQNIKSDMRFKGLKGKEYIHCIGKFNEYLIYLNK